jgi:hypothetical protein
VKFTRRQVVAAAAGSVAAGSVAAANAFAQSPPGASVTASDAAKQARDAVARNADTLARLAVPISTEPAFQFKA